MALLLIHDLWKMLAENILEKKVEEQDSYLPVTIKHVKDEHSWSLSVSPSYSLHQPNSTPRVDEW